jgi:hypothetical protein
MPVSDEDFPRASLAVQSVSDNQSRRLVHGLPARPRSSTVQAEAAGCSWNACILQDTAETLPPAEI